MLSITDHTTSNYWLNLIYLDPKLKINKNKIIDSLGKLNIQARPVWRLNHTQKPYQNEQSFNITNAQRLVKNYICLPSSPNLTKKQIKFISRKIINLIMNY